jgi:aspartyl/asparaginyl-tRNA synthetase
VGFPSEWVSKPMLKYIGGVSRESVVDVCVLVQKA